MVQKTVIEWLEANHPNYYSSAKIAELNDLYVKLDHYIQEQIKAGSIPIHNRILVSVKIKNLELELIKEALGIQDG